MKELRKAMLQEALDAHPSRCEDTRKRRGIHEEETLKPRLHGTGKRLNLKELLHLYK